MYEVVVREEAKVGLPPRWSPEVGHDNCFETLEEAIEAMKSLAGLGDDWTDGVYGVREYGSDARPEVILHPQYGLCQIGSPDYGMALHN